jgi:hypothetical protein
MTGMKRPRHREDVILFGEKTREAGEPLEPSRAKPLTARGTNEAADGTPVPIVNVFETRDSDGDGMPDLTELFENPLPVLPVLRVKPGKTPISNPARLKTPPENP